MDLKGMSAEELKNLKLSIEKEELERKELETEKRRLKASEMIERLKNSGIIDFISHNRTSCSDEYPSNGYYDSVGYARCKKCHLIEVLESHECEIHDFEVHLDIRIEKIEK